MSDKYITLTDDTVDGLGDQINVLAKEGYELDKYEQNNYYDGEWQGIAIMKRMDIATSDSNLPLHPVMLSAFIDYCTEWGTYNNHGDNLWYEYSPLEAHHRSTKTTEQMLTDFNKLHSA